MRVMLVSKSKQNKATCLAELGETSEEVEGGEMAGEVKGDAMGSIFFGPNDAKIRALTR
jgi:hypothetical protein